MKKISSSLGCLYWTFSLVFFVISESITAQSSEYTIESFQGEYTELPTYQSIALLTKGDPLWEYDFQLDFPFPFYDSTYTWMHYEQDSWGYFTADQDLALFLFRYSRSYTYDNVLDTSNIPSDVRFSHVEAGGMQAFVIQFTKNRFFADPFQDSLDTYFNFQLWFYENGIIEVHFGELHMNNTPFYKPGKGFFCYTTSEGIDTNEICGPFMGISHPLDEENAIALDGAYNDYEVSGNLYSIMTELPPEGWIIRFKPIWVGTSEQRPTFERLSIIPNPTNSFVQLPIMGDRVFIVDVTGKIVYDGYPIQDNVDVSGLPSGIYYIHILSNNKISIGKFVRQ